MPEFASRSYWEERYRGGAGGGAGDGGAAPFDWYMDYAALKPALTALVPSLTAASRVLVVGCGTSTLGEQLYDDGVDVKKKKKKKSPYDSDSSDSEDEDGNKKKSLREEIERKYFPENFKFWPFGDPFVEKRRHDARKAKEAEQAKQRKANLHAAPPRQTWGFGDY
jgi:hypothetical protein